MNLETIPFRNKLDFVEGVRRESNNIKLKFYLHADPDLLLNESLFISDNIEETIKIFIEDI